MGDRARDKVSWDDFSVWLSALKPRGIGLSEHFSAKYQDEAHYRWACSPGTQPSWTLEQKAFEIFREKVILLPSHHSCWPCLYKRMDQSISIVIWFDWFCRPVLCRWVIQAVGGFYSNHLLLLDLRARCLSMTMTKHPFDMTLWDLIWLQGIHFPESQEFKKFVWHSKNVWSDFWWRWLFYDHQFYVLWHH